MQNSQLADRFDAGLRSALEGLGGAARRKHLAAALAAGIDAAATKLEAMILRQIPAYSSSADPDVLQELGQHVASLGRELLRLVRGGEVGDFAFVREHARRSAEQRFPLEALLHACRCGRKVYSQWLREAGGEADSTASLVRDVADFAMEYCDTVGSIVAGEYVAYTRLLSAVAGDQRAELLRILIDGHDEADGRASRLLRDAGYLDQRQAFCVAIAQPVDPVEMQNPARARRLAESIDAALKSLAGRRLIDLRDYKVAVVCSYPRRQSGWSAPNTALASRMKEELDRVGPAALIGISNDVPSTAHVPSAYREAQLALELADVTRRVSQFADIPLRRMIVHLAGADAGRVLPAWTRELLLADEAAEGALVATLRAYADADMNVLKAAKRLKLHPNTVYARLQRIADACGRDARSYHALTEMLLAVDCSA